MKDDIKRKMLILLLATLYVLYQATTVYRRKETKKSKARFRLSNISVFMSTLYIHYYYYYLLRGPSLFMLGLIEIEIFNASHWFNIKKEIEPEHTIPKAN